MLGLLSVVALKVDATAGDLVGGERYSRPKMVSVVRPEAGAQRRTLSGTMALVSAATRKVVWRGRRAATLCDGESWEVLSAELSEGALAVTERGLHDTSLHALRTGRSTESKIAGKAGKARKAANERFHVACSPFCG
jgi:hypothetical protein